MSTIEEISPHHLTPISPTPVPQHVLATLTQQFDYVILDSPAGIESGAKHAMYFADDAIVVTNPELSSCRDADKMIGFISSRSRRAEMGAAPVTQTLLITRYDPERADKNESLSIADIQDLLGLDLVGVIPESKVRLGMRTGIQVRLMVEIEAWVKLRHSS